MRSKGCMGRADQTTKVKGLFVRPEQVAEIGKRHPELGRRCQPRGRNRRDDIAGGMRLPERYAARSALLDFAHHCKTRRAMSNPSVAARCRTMQGDRG